MYSSRLVVRIFLRKYVHKSTQKSNDARRHSVVGFIIFRHDMAGGRFAILRRLYVLYNKHCFGSSNDGYWEGDSTSSSHVI